MGFFYFLISAIYFFLPAYFTNMTPPLLHQLHLFNFLGKPIDGGRKFRGKPIFGSHKTWRGAIFGFFVGSLVVLLQRYLFRFPSFKSISILDYSNERVFFLAFLIPLGTIIGDLSSAFIKRRLSLKPGAPFIPWDQTNYVFGVFFLLTPFLRIGLVVWLTVLLLTFFLHLLVNYIGFLLGLSRAKL